MTIMLLTFWSDYTTKTPRIPNPLVFVLTQARGLYGPYIKKCPAPQCFATKPAAMKPQRHDMKSQNVLAGTQVCPFVLWMAKSQFLQEISFVYHRLFQRYKTKSHTSGQENHRLYQVQGPQAPDGQQPMNPSPPVNPQANWQCFGNKFQCVFSPKCSEPQTLPRHLESPQASGKRLLRLLLTNHPPRMVCEVQITLRESFLHALSSEIL